MPMTLTSGKVCGRGYDVTMPAVLDSLLEVGGNRAIVSDPVDDSSRDVWAAQPPRVAERLFVRRLHADVCRVLVKHARHDVVPDPLHLVFPLHSVQVVRLRQLGTPRICPDHEDGGLVCTEAPR